MFKLMLTAFLAALISFLYLLDKPLSSGQLLLIAIVAIFIIWSFISQGPSLKLPPGPLHVPFIGVIQTFANKDLHELIRSWHQKYGSIVNISIGDHYVFSISNYKMIKELSVHPNLQMRPDSGFSEFSNGLGVVTSEGNLWKHQRRFVLHSLRDSGMGKLRIEDKIQAELSKVVEILRESHSKPTTVHEVLQKSTSNIIFALAFNKQFDYDDEDFKNRIQALDENLKLFAKIGAVSLFKWLKPFLGGLTRKVVDNVNLLKEQSQEFIDEHLKDFDKENPRDLLDLYLIEMFKEDDDGENNEEYRKTFFMEQLKFLIIDLFVGGTETSSTTIRWAILYMMHNPAIQKKVKLELDEVVGSERSPSMEDKIRLPYTMATLQEVERLASAIPAALPRSNDKAIHFNGYDFPPRSIINFSLYTLHRDPELWKDPFKFDPSRFIDSEGKVFRPPFLAPFGSGKRACPGEALARMEIFIYFTTLMQNFKFEVPKGEPLPPLTSPPSAVRTPHVYKVCCIPYSS